MTEQEEWICCVCGKKTSTPHTHDLSELITAFKKGDLQERVERDGLPAEQLARKRILS